MFAPDQQRVADQLVRVCRPGGRIGMTNWTPDSLVGDLLAVYRKHNRATDGTVAAPSEYAEVVATVA